LRPRLDRVLVNTVWVVVAAADDVLLREGLGKPGGIAASR
jgi:hypothetical protein